MGFMKIDKYRANRAGTIYIVEVGKYISIGRGTSTCKDEAVLGIATKCVAKGYLPAIRVVALKKVSNAVEAEVKLNTLVYKYKCPDSDCYDIPKDELAKAWESI